MQTYTYEDLAGIEKAHGVVCGPYRRALLLKSAPESIRHWLKRAKREPWPKAMARQTFSSISAEPPPAAFAAVGASSVAEANLWTLIGNWSPIPANDMQAGKTYKVCCGGLLTTDLTPTVGWTGRIGTSATPGSNTIFGAVSTLVATGSGLTAVPWYAELTVIVRSIGVAASGAALWGTGWSVIGNAATAAAQANVFGGAATSVDNTVAQGLMISITFGTSHASNAFTTEWVNMRSMN